MDLPDPLRTALAYAGNQIGGTFLAPGSTLSLPSLAVTLAIAVLLIAHRRGSRPLRLRVLWRALVPRRTWRSRSGRLDALFLAYSLLGAGLATGWAILAADQVRGVVRDLAGAPPATAAPTLGTGIVVSLVLFVAYEFAYWLDHWLKHRVRLLWLFHRVHHSAESLSLLTIFRVHPVDTLIFYNLVALVTGTAAALVEMALGCRADPLAIAGTAALTLVAGAGITHLQHSHLWITFGPRWGRLLLGAAHHQLHHSADPRHHNRNLGNVLTLFDRLFGTFTMPAATRERLRFGVDGLDHDPHGVAGAMLRPFADALPSPAPRRRQPA